MLQRAANLLLYVTSVARCALRENCPFTGKYERVLEVVVDVYHRAVTLFDRFHDANR